MTGTAALYVVVEDGEHTVAAGWSPKEAAANLLQHLAVERVPKPAASREICLMVLEGDSDREATPAERASFLNRMYEEGWVMTRSPRFAVINGGGEA